MPVIPETNEVSFTITPDKDSQGEPTKKSQREVVKEIKSLTKGSVKGYIGEVPPSLRDTEVEVENLTDAEKVIKRELREFLGRTLNPPTVSIKTPPEQARNILVKKLSNMTLGELRRFWAKAIPESLEEEDRTLIQKRWDDISP